MLLKILCWKKILSWPYSSTLLFLVGFVSGASLFAIKTEKKHCQFLKTNSLSKKLYNGTSSVWTLVSTHALHTLRINLSPFTKDFRVRGALIEKNRIYLGTVLGQCTHQYAIICCFSSNASVNPRIKCIQPLPRALKIEKLSFQQTVQRWRCKYLFSKGCTT